jgi:hypothetical protein
VNLVRRAKGARVFSLISPRAGQVISSPDLLSRGDGWVSRKGAAEGICFAKSPR